MNKENRKYLYIFFGLFAVIVIAQYLLPKPVNWNRSYIAKDKSPFGCYAIHALMDGTYTKDFTSNNKTLYNLNDIIEDSSSVLIINDNINFSKSDMRSLFDMLENGSTIFIASNTFDGPIADTFHLKTRFEFFDYFSVIDSVISKPGVEISLTASNFKKKNYKYSKAAWASSFSNFDTSKFSILATIEKQKACLIKSRIGSGTLYLMSSPDIFGNYFIVNNKNRELVYTLLSLLKNPHMVWDEYYKTYNVQKDSPLKFIFESDALYTAYILLLLTLIIYMITEGRRRQRAIPVIEPVTNSTLEFVNVISHVYFNSKNHQGIAVERIKYFYETIRKKFNVNTDSIGEEVLNEITVLSGIEHKLVKQLFSYCERIKKSEEITEQELIELNRQISNFNKNSLR